MRLAARRGRCVARRGRGRRSCGHGTRRCLRGGLVLAMSPVGDLEAFLLRHPYSPRRPRHFSRTRAIDVEASMRPQSLQGRDRPVYNDRALLGPPMRDSAGALFESLLSIMSRLRSEGGCPWDREQTRESLKPYLIEEAYEALEAL